MAAAAMSLELHGCGIHVVGRRGRGRGGNQQAAFLKAMELLEAELRARDDQR